MGIAIGIRNGEIPLAADERTAFNPSVLPLQSAIPSVFPDRSDQDIVIFLGSCVHRELTMQKKVHAHGRHDTTSVQLLRLIKQPSRTNSLAVRC